MKLQENISRTKKLMGLLAETTKYIQGFQELIDLNLAYIHRVCDKTENYYQGDVGEDSCNAIRSIEKIVVTESDWMYIKRVSQKEEKIMSVVVRVYLKEGTELDSEFDDLRFYIENLIYDLEQIIRNSTGLPFILNHKIND